MVARIVVRRRPLERRSGFRLVRLVVRVPRWVVRSLSSELPLSITPAIFIPLLLKVPLVVVWAAASNPGVPRINALGRAGFSILSQGRRRSLGSSAVDRSSTAVDRERLVFLLLLLRAAAAAAAFHSALLPPSPGEEVAPPAGVCQLRCGEDQYDPHQDHPLSTAAKKHLGILILGRRGEKWCEDSPVGSLTIKADMEKKHCIVPGFRYYWLFVSFDTIGELKHHKRKAEL